ncbi:acetyltransferase family protein, partial [Chlamydia psittaci C1/97]
CMKKTRR